MDLVDFNSFCRACRAFSSPLGQRWQKSQSTPREQPLWCQNHAQGLQVSGCLGFQVREFTNAGEITSGFLSGGVMNLYQFICQDAALSLWRGLGAALMLLPRTWAIVCPDVKPSMLTEHVSSCSYIFIIFPCILQCFELKSKKFIQTHRNREEGRTIQASLNFLRFLLWFAHMAEQASQTKTALQLQTVSVDFGSRSQRAMTYNFTAQAPGKKKNKSCHLKFQLQQKSLLHPNYIGYWLVKRGILQWLGILQWHSNNL